MFIGSSLNPDYFKEKVGTFVALAPVVRLDHSLNKAMVMASQLVGVLSDAVQFLHLYNLLPRNPASPAIGQFCELVPEICSAMNEGFFEFDKKIDNMSRIGAKSAHSPSGSGWRNLIHYAQIIKSKKF